jgi:hypothetical protein
MASYRANVKRIFPDAVLARHNRRARRADVAGSECADSTDHVVRVSDCMISRFSAAS